MMKLRSDLSVMPAKIMAINENQANNASRIQVIRSTKVREQKSYFISTVNRLLCNQDMRACRLVLTYRNVSTYRESG